jgi:hypothetical protein
VESLGPGHARDEWVRSGRECQEDHRGAPTGRGREGRDRAPGESSEVMSQRGQTQGLIGTLKHYGFSGRRERSNHTAEAAGQRARVSLNLNKLMRDLLAKGKQARKAAA